MRYTWPREDGDHPDSHVTPALSPPEEQLGCPEMVDAGCLQTLVGAGDRPNPVLGACARAWFPLRRQHFPPAADFAAPQIARVPVSPPSSLRDPAPDRARSLDRPRPSPRTCRDARWPRPEAAARGRGDDERVPALQRRRPLPAPAARRRPPGPVHRARAGRPPTAALPGAAPLLSLNSSDAPELGSTGPAAKLSCHPNPLPLKLSQPGGRSQLLQGPDALLRAHHRALSELSPWRGGSRVQCLPTLKPRPVAKISHHESSPAPSAPVGTVYLLTGGRVRLAEGWRERTSPAFTAACLYSLFPNPPIHLLTYLSTLTSSPHLFFHSPVYIPYPSSHHSAACYLLPQSPGHPLLTHVPPHGHQPGPLLSAGRAGCGHSSSFKCEGKPGQ